MNKSLNKRGGARFGAGRKPSINKAKPHTLNFTDEDWTKLKSLGGAKWIRKILWCQ